MSNRTQNPDKPEEYYRGLNVRLLRAIPETARRLMDVGCSEGRLGAAIKRRLPECAVFGLEREAAPAQEARTRLDDVFNIDLTAEPIPLEPASLDVVTCGDILEHLYDPLAALKKLRTLLKPDGQILISLPNAQHHTIIDALLRGDFQYVELGLMDWTHARFFTYSSFVKIMMDAGFKPAIADVTLQESPEGWISSFSGWLRRSGWGAERLKFHTDVFQYLFRGTLLAPVPQDTAAPLTKPMTFVVCVNDEAVLKENLLRSPFLLGNTPHQIILQRGFRSAGEALNDALPKAVHDLVVLVHQDVYLPENWDQRVRWQLHETEHSIGKWGVAGVFGCTRRRMRHVRHGHLVDRTLQFCKRGPFPRAVETLDEVCLIMPRDTALRGDPKLGYHQYATDLAMQAKHLGLPTVVIEAPLFHNSKLYEVPDEFYDATHYLAKKWSSDLPIPSPCQMIDERFLVSASRPDKTLKDMWVSARSAAKRLLFKSARRKHAKFERLWKI